MSADDIAAGVGKALNARPADFQLRVLLRLFVQTHPPLLSRVRARYQPLDKKFAANARLLWKSLRPDG